MAIPTDTHDLTTTPAPTTPASTTPCRGPPGGGNRRRAAAGASRDVDIGGIVIAVDGIDLDVRDGEFFSMLGPSGSGKTTTLRMIAGFELPTAGRILLHGADVTRVPPFDRDVNTVFQDYALFPHMTVGDNVAYGLMVRKVPKAERARRVTDALRMVRLEGYETRKPASCRVASASAWRLPGRSSNRPRVLLLDEPLGALDLKLREEMQIELKAIQQQVGITFIYVTHDQEEALTMSDRLAVFNARPDRADRVTGGGLRATGHPVRRRVRRDVQPVGRRCRTDDPRTTGDVHDPAREDPPCIGRRQPSGRTRRPRRARSTASSIWDLIRATSSILKRGRDSS